MDVARENTQTQLISAKEDTWSNQRRKRREKQREEAQAPPSKKAKADEEKKEVTEPYLQFRVKVLGEKNKKVVVHFLWVSGGRGKESVAQVVTFIKNNWNPKEIT